MTRSISSVIPPAARTVWALRGRLLGLAVLTALGVGFSVSVLGVAHSAEASVHDRGVNAVALRTLEVTAHPERPELKRLIEPNLDTVRALPGVESVEPTAQVSFGIKTAQVPGVLLYGHLPQPSRLPPIVRAYRAAVFPLRAGEAVVPASAQGTDLSMLLGTRVPVQVQRTTGHGTGAGETEYVTVVGLSDPGYQVDGPDSAYVDSNLVAGWIGLREQVDGAAVSDLRGYDSALVVVHRAHDVADVLARLQAMPFAASSEQQTLQDLPGVVRLLDRAGSVLLVVVLVVVCFGTAALTGSLLRQRTREIGIMRAIGFSTLRIAAMLGVEQAIFTVAACLAGLTVAVPGLLAVAALARSHADVASLIPGGLVLPSGAVVVTSVLAIAGASALGAVPALLRALRMQPVEALRDL